MLDLTLACADTDRTAQLEAEVVRPAGVRLNVVRLPVEEIFHRMITHREFDAAELSLSSYTISLRSTPQPFVAIPAFPSRSFRHGFIFVNRRSGVASPADLVDRCVGTPEYEITAAVWIRGVLAEHHGLALTAPRYVTGGLEEPGRRAKSWIDLPEGVGVEPIPAGDTLSAMLADGRIDALYTAREPSCFTRGHPDVGRLFPNPIDAETDYFRRTGIFPIMHTVALRREVYEGHRWLAAELMKAMDRARRRSLTRLRENVTLPVMVPWLAHHLQQTTKLMGDDYWPYGVDANRTTLKTFLRYAREQGIADRALEPEDLFAPETLTATRV